MPHRRGRKPIHARLAGQVKQDLREGKLTVSQIALKRGISRGTVYNYQPQQWRRRRPGTLLAVRCRSCGQPLPKPPAEMKFERLKEPRRCLECGSMIVLWPCPACFARGQG